MLTSNCIIWNGPDIACMDLCKGDSISDVVFKIASELCTILNELDLTSLDLSCILDKAQKNKKIDLYLLFSILLHNDCKLKDLVDAKFDELDTTELLVNNVDIKCFLQDYLDEICTIIRFYNQPGLEVNPNNDDTIFQKSEVKTQGIYYVSDVDQSVWEWNGLQYVKNLIADLNTNCVCDLESLDLDVPKVLQVIINNICQTQSTGIIKAGDSQYKTVHFNTVDPNTISTTFTGGLDKQQGYYYISSVTHYIWRWVEDENQYLPSLLTSSNINVKDINTFLLSLESTFQNWVDLYQVYSEPLIQSCLSDEDNILSVHLTEVTDKAICRLSSSIGSPKDVWFSGLSKCDNIVYFTGVANGPDMVIDGVSNDSDVIYVNLNDDYPWVWNGLQYTPYLVNLSFVENHQWSKTCDLLNRLKTLETTCCTPTCDNTTIGFSSTLSDGVYTLTFDKASGTNIGEEFVDCGSIITGTDWKNKSVSADITLEQGLVFDFDLNDLDLTHDIIINIKSCLSQDNLTCKNCFTKTLEGFNPCGLCKLCVIDSSENSDGLLLLTYTLASNPSLVLKTEMIGGQCITFSLPEDEPTIISIERTVDSIELINSDETPCDIELPGISTKACWYFPIPARDVSVTMDVDNILIGRAFDQDYIAGDSNYAGQSTVFNSITYSKLFVNNTEINITGEVTDFNEILPGSKEGGLQKELSTDKVETFPILPTSLGDITGSTCGKITYSYFNGAGQGTQNSSMSSPLVLGWTREHEGQHGIILNIATLSNPEIELIDTITGNKLYIKGEPLTDCNCPS